MQGEVLRIPGNAARYGKQGADLRKPKNIVLRGKLCKFGEIRES